MMNIQSLLNPSTPGTRSYSDTTNTTGFTARSEYSPADSPIQQSPVPSTPTTVSTVHHRKRDLEKAVFAGNSAHSAVNYPPHELHEEARRLSKIDHDELIRQHKLFKIKLSTADGSGLISDSTRYIPYSSDKKSFFGKTGRDGFNGE